MPLVIFFVYTHVHFKARDYTEIRVIHGIFYSIQQKRFAELPFAFCKDVLRPGNIFKIKKDNKNEKSLII